MDPIENIREQRRLAAKIQAAWDDCDDTGEVEAIESEDISEHALELAELVLALDEWRRKGGFDPYTAKEHTR